MVNCWLLKNVEMNYIDLKQAQMAGEFWWDSLSLEAKINNLNTRLIAHEKAYAYWFVHGGMFDITKKEEKEDE